MRLHRESFASPKLARVVAAVVVGLNTGTFVPPERVVLPGVGAVPALLICGAGLVTGGVLYLWVPKLAGTSGCGCSGDCDCS